jgi:hypothetical protein
MQKVHEGIFFILSVKNLSFCLLPVQFLLKIFGRRRPAGNMGIAKMQADGSRVSTFVILLGGISSLTLSI